MEVLAATTQNLNGQHKVTAARLKHLSDYYNARMQRYYINELDLIYRILKLKAVF